MTEDSCYVTFTLWFVRSGAKRSHWSKMRPGVCVQGGRPFWCRETFQEVQKVRRLGLQGLQRVCTRQVRIPLSAAQYITCMAQLNKKQCGSVVVYVNGWHTMLSPDLQCEDSITVRGWADRLVRTRGWLERCGDQAAAVSCCKGTSCILLYIWTSLFNPSARYSVLLKGDLVYYAFPSFLSYTM